MDFGPDASRRIFRSDDLVIRFWLHVQADEWTMKHAANADVLVALDNLAVYAVWQLAQINKRAEARLGLPRPSMLLSELPRRTHLVEP